MKSALLMTLILIAAMSRAQMEDTSVVPTVMTVTVEEGAVTILHLSPGYATSVRLPEEISSVVVGNPANFRAEHSESESRLVFFKPVTIQPCQSNALITTKSGQEISLHLVSAGKSIAHARVDFLIEYRRQSSLIIPSGRSTFLIADSPGASVSTGISRSEAGTPDVLEAELEKQKALSTPKWEGKEFLGAVGNLFERERKAMVAFSVLNDSARVVELLPPQIELRGAMKKGKGKAIEAEPIPISEYRLSNRSLSPGQRADGVVVFERPAFKASNETLQLRLAQAAQVDRPILLPVPFTSGEIP